jgi:hypothetical protein
VNRNVCVVSAAVGVRVLGADVLAAAELAAAGVSAIAKPAAASATVSCPSLRWYLKVVDIIWPSFSASN